MPAAQKASSEYERGYIGLREVKPNSDYGQLALRPATYGELELKAPQTVYDDASVLQ